MKVEEFVTKIRGSVVDENLYAYRSIFKTTSVSDAADSYWKEALTFFNGLDQNQRDVLFEIIRQVEVDTVSNMLGVLDNTTVLENQEDNFELRYGQEVFSGSLQDVFLEQEETDK